MANEPSRWITEGAQKLIVSLLGAGILAGLTAGITFERRMATLEEQVRPALEISVIRTDLATLKEHQRGMEYRLTALEAPGPRFTPLDAKDLEKELRAEMKETAGRIRELEGALRRIERRVGQ